MFQQTLQRGKKAEPTEEQGPEQAVNFIIDEGTGCVNNGCSKGIIGKDTLEVYNNRWHATGGGALQYQGFRVWRLFAPNFNFKSNQEEFVPTGNYLWAPYDATPSTRQVHTLSNQVQDIPKLRSSTKAHQ